MRGLLSVNVKGLAKFTSEEEKLKMAHEDRKINKEKKNTQTVCSQQLTLSLAKDIVMIIKI